MNLLSYCVPLTSTSLYFLFFFFLSCAIALSTLTPNLFVLVGRILRGRFDDMEINPDLSFKPPPILKPLLQRKRQLEIGR